MALIFKAGKWGLGFNNISIHKTEKFQLFKLFNASTTYEMIMKQLNREENKKIQSCSFLRYISRMYDRDRDLHNFSASIRCDVTRA